MVWRIGLVGCGTVGKGLVSLLDVKRDSLAEMYGFEFDLCFVSDFARGTLVSAEGLDLREIVQHLDARGNLHEVPGVRTEPVPLADLLTELAELAKKPVDIVCDATPTNYETGQPSRGILETALERGVNAVTCSKGGVGTDLHGLKKTASQKGVKLRFESSVLSGTPLLNLVRGPLAGCRIENVQGIVNGTTNYILTRMEEGMHYGDALAEAQRLGYAETDPTGDVEGFDAAVKVCIMANEFFGAHLRVADVERRGIASVTREQVLAARDEGKRLKLIAGVERDGDRVRGYVEPMAIDLTQPLASVMGAVNAVCLRTDNLGDVTISGPGAGARETAQGLLSDILDIAGVIG